MPARLSWFFRANDNEVNGYPGFWLERGRRSFRRCSRRASAPGESLRNRRLAQDFNPGIAGQWPIGREQADAVVPESSVVSGNGRHRLGLIDGTQQYLPHGDVVNGLQMVEAQRRRGSRPARLSCDAGWLRILDALTGPLPETPADQQRTRDREKIERAFPEIEP
jgi:hypothetical protein